MANDNGALGAACMLSGAVAALGVVCPPLFLLGGGLLAVSAACAARNENSNQSSEREEERPMYDPYLPALNTRPWDMIPRYTPPSVDPLSVLAFRQPFTASSIMRARIVADREIALSGFQSTLLSTLGTELIRSGRHRARGEAVTTSGSWLFPKTTRTRFWIEVD